MNNHQLYFKKPNGRYTEAGIDETRAHYQDLLGEMFLRENGGKPLTNPRAAREYLYSHVTLDNENFVVAFLDTKHRVISCAELFSGTLDMCAVPIREIIKRCLELRSNAIILAHGHPSADTSPSQSDIRLTKDVYEACSYIRVKLLDHFIFGGGGHENGISLAELGQLHP